MKSVYFNIGNQADIERYNRQAAKLAQRAGTVSLRIERPYRTQRMVEDAATICTAVGGKIGLVGGPCNNWQKPYLPKDATVAFRGPEYEAHFAAYDAAYEDLADWLGERMDLVGQIHFDIERWKVGSAAENKALAETYNRMIQQAKKYFPAAHVTVYDLGIWWGAPSNHWTEGVKLDSVAVSLLCPNCMDELNQWIKVAVDTANKTKRPVTAWCQCGQGYAKVDWQSFKKPLEVTRRNAIQLGVILANTPEIESVVIHPGPAGTPEWDQHFDGLIEGLTK